MIDLTSNQRTREGTIVSETSLPGDVRTFTAIASHPVALSAETTSLESLAQHQWSIEYDTPLEAVHRSFRERNVDFMALVREGRVTGLCSRARLGFMLGSRYGFALFSRSPAHLAQVAHPLVFTNVTPVRRVLDSTLARKGDEFHEDVILVDGDHRLLGLITVEALANLQTRLVGEQLDELRRQHEQLRQQGLEHFQANHALRQTQGLYHGLFESNTLGVALLDIHGTVQTHNRRLAELLNLGDGPIEVLALSSWVVERERPLFRNLLLAHERQDLTPATHEFTLQIPHRGPRLFRFSTGWIRETSQVCACIEDITHQRALERHMHREEKQLLLDTLVGGIAHELNNKLAPVMGFAALLQPKLDGESQRYASYISKSTVEAAHIIRQLLQLSRPDSGHLQIIDLRQIVEESLVLMKFQIRECETTMRTVLPPEPVTVLADGAQLKQVLMNLVINALHAMETTPAPLLTITVDQCNGSGMMTVTDNGAGIPPEIMGRIFDPFFTTKGPDKGSGLGLSICFSIARKHNGDITVESEPGCGASFTVTLPVAIGDSSAADPTSERSGCPVPAGELARRRVLVVEDEDVLRKLKQEIIRSHFGCRVDVATNVAEGLALAAHSGYDLVISDIRMPEMSGIELYLRLRELQPELAKRFLFVSGAGDKQIDAEVKRWNVPLIAKPFTVTRLIEACLPFLRSAEKAALSA